MGGPSPYTSLQDAARMFAVHPRTLRRLISAGQLPAYRVGNQIRIATVDLEKAIRPIPTAGESQ